MSTVGVLGAGQLGRMLALAGLPLGLRFRFLDPDPSPPAAALGTHVCASFTDHDALREFAHGCDVVTFESEAVPFEAARLVAEHVPVRPSPEVLRITQDRLAEKLFVRDLGLPLASFAAVENSAGLVAALHAVGLPAVLKTRTGGYDGRGQVRIDDPREAEAAWAQLGHAPAVLERWVPFEREIALLAVRGMSGEARHYPLIETRQSGHQLAQAVAPAPAVGVRLRRQATRIAQRLLGALDHVGVLAIECFQADGRLLINELAPRVHNSGHWTVEGAYTSQFENHLRAILGWPLGSTATAGATGLVNVIGCMPAREPLLALPGTHLHLYDKTAAPRRKLGHITVRAGRLSELARRMKAVEDCLLKLDPSRARSSS